MMVSNNHPKKLGSFVFPPFRPQYQFNLAKSISQVVFKKQHALDRIITQDVLCLADTRERLKCYRAIQENAYRIFIQLAGKYFSMSPHEKRTELPLMILTDTKSIFLRRIKRLKIAQKKDSFKNSSSSSFSYQTYSHSYEPQSNFKYLTSNISQKSFTYLRNSRKSQASFGSQIHIFHFSYSLNESDVNLNLRAIEQSIKQSTLRMKLLTGFDEQEKQLIKTIKQADSYQLNHLICTYEQEQHQISVHSKKQPQANFSKAQRRQSKMEYLRKLSNEYEPNVEEQDLLIENMPFQIKYRLGKQLTKYKLNTVPISIHSSGINKSKKKVREKAEQMLKELGLHYYHH